MAIDWNAIYAEELARIDDPTTQINSERDAALGALTSNKDTSLTALEARKQSDIDAMNDTKTAQENKLDAALADALRSAYISREKNKKDIPALMSNLGLTGGITESAAIDLLRDYRNSRNAANKSHDTSITDLNTGYNSNLAALNSQYQGNWDDIISAYNTNYSNAQRDYEQQLREALSAREANATTNANTRYAQKVAEENAAWERAQAEAAANQPTQIIATQPSGPSNPNPTPEELKQQGYSTGYNYGQGAVSGATSDPMDQANQQKARSVQQGTALDNQMRAQGKEKVVTPYGTYYR